MGAGAIIAAAPNEYLIAAETYTQGTHEDMELLKINNDGDTLWTKIFRYPDHEYTPIIKKLNDNSIIISYTYNSPSKVILLKLIESGDTIWTKSDVNMRITDIECNNNGEILLLGSTSILGPTYIFKIDSLGKILSQKQICEPPYFGYKFLHSTDGNLLVYGYNSPSSDTSIVWIYKLTSNLDSIWSKTYSNDIKVIQASMCNSGLGGYLLSGNTNTGSLIMKIDETGQLLWENTYNNSTAFKSFHTIIPTSENGFIIAGVVQSSADNFDAWISLFNPEKPSAVLSDIKISNYFLSQNYPNPYNPNTIIKYSIPRSSLVNIKLYNILGNEIKILVSEEKPAGTYELTFNAANLPSGVYFYRIQAGSYIETKKMMLLK
jgi:hypothetical protein